MRSKVIPSRWKLRMGFVLIPLAHSAGMNIVILLAFRYLTDDLAISAAAAGTMFALVKIFDGILDPAVGAWSDRLRSPLGRRIPFLAAGGILMPLGIAMIFNVPNFGSLLLVQAFVTVALIIHAAAYTLLTIPGMGMLIEVVGDAHERTVLMAYRVFGNSAGVIVGSTLPAMLLGAWGTGRVAHGAMSLIVAAVVLVAGALAIWLLWDAPRIAPSETPPGTRFSMVTQARIAWANVPFRVLALAHIFVLIGTTVTSGASAYFSKYVLKLPDSWLGSYFLLATLGSVVAMPMWVWISKRMGKKRSYIAAMLGYGLLQLGWWSATPGESMAMLVARAVIIGLFSGGVILCSYSMLSDAVRFDYIQCGQRREGAFAGFTTLFDKLSAAAGIALLGAFLQSMGYVASHGGGAVRQPPGAIMAITLCMALVPLATMLCAIMVVSRYTLDAAALEEGDAA